MSSKMMFEPTLPADAADLMRVSAFRRYLQDDEESVPARLSTRLSALNPSLVQDLRRFEAATGPAPAPALELLEVMAAAVRHGRRLRMHLQHELRTLPLTVFPGPGLVHCPLPMAILLELRLGSLQVLHVEPAVLGAPGDGQGTRMAEKHLYSPLGPLLWELSLRGAREDLLPEVAGVAAYRVAPGADLRALGLSGTLAAAVLRLQRDNANLREIANWPGFDRSRATRMLNGLYLQAALIISRTHPAASSEARPRSRVEAFDD